MEEEITIVENDESYELSNADKLVKLLFGTIAGFVASRVAEQAFDSFIVYRERRRRQ